MLSKRAQKLYERVRAGRWYSASFDGKEPKAMKELVDAGLVVVAGRVQVISAAYVPHDYTPFKIETWPGKDGVSQKPEWGASGAQEQDPNYEVMFDRMEDLK